jgi:hypothetical protein
MRDRQWIAVRQGELGAFVGKLAQQLQEFQGERDELAIV